MNLQNCHGTVVYVGCLSCGTTGDINRFYADLEGEPFKAYYCRSCAARMLNLQPIKAEQ